MTPETKVDALRDVAHKMFCDLVDTGYVMSLGPLRPEGNPYEKKQAAIDLIVGLLAQHITLAQQAATQRAINTFMDAYCGNEPTSPLVDTVRGIKAMESLLGGSASALELALAQAREQEHKNSCDICADGIIDRCSRGSELRARIAALSGGEKK